MTEALPTTTAPESAIPTRELSLTVNGRPCRVVCQDRQLLVEVLREQLRLKGTHIGCLNGDCGACTVELDGKAIKSCLVLAPAAEGSEIITLEGVGPDGGGLDPLQQAFWDNDGFQCGFCVPGQIFAARQLLARTLEPSDAEIREAVAGNICRCTGYQTIIESVRAAAQAIGEGTEGLVPEVDTPA
ncbi:MAG: (2Fe-2S)-binding protein [Modestobacter sp.]|jgi:aerobic-type carbon monoxide dehydrogenase small subunit (CoxS/CutS family)|nr:(2Fe-2S)-binding protein [Modestobacter sp.]